MSYEIRDAQADELTRTLEAIEDDDYITLRELASQAAARDDMEEAKRLKKFAKNAWDNCFAYDESIGN